MCPVTEWPAAVRRRPSGGLPDQVGQARAQPPGVSRVGPPDRVRDAGQRHPGLHEREPQQVGEVDGHLALHHPVDPQPPRRRVDLGREQGGVEAVEAVIRSDERARGRGCSGCCPGRTGGREPRAGGTGWRCGPRRRCAHWSGFLRRPSPARPAAAAPLESGTTRRAGQRDLDVGKSCRGTEGAGRATGDQKRVRGVREGKGSGGRERSVGRASAPAGTAGPGGVRAGGEPSLAAARASQVSATAPAAAPTRVGTAYPAVASGLVSAAAGPRAAKTASPARPKASPAYRDYPDHRGVQGEDHQDAAEQRRLVVGAERRDGEVLDLRRGPIDGGLAHREHWRALRNAEARRERGGADGDGGREHASHSPGEGANAPRLVGGDVGRCCHGGRSRLGTFPTVRARVRRLAARY